MPNLDSVLERIADEHLRLHPDDPQDHPVITDVPGLHVEHMVVGLVGPLMDYPEVATDRWEPSVLQFSAVAVGQQAATLRAI